MKVVIAGTGMYVTGRGGPGQGTLLAAMAEAAVEGLVSEVFLVGRSDADRQWLEQRAGELQRRLKSPLIIRFVFTKGDDFTEQLSALIRFEKCVALVVSTPDQTHFEIVRAGLEANCHVLAVKPLVTNVGHCRALADLALRQRRHGVIEYHKRHDESNLLVKKALQDGSLGKLSWVEVSYSQRIGIPRDTFRSWAETTNIFQYLGVHYVDLIEFLTGYYPRRLCALSTTGVLKRAGIDTPDSVHVISEWQAPDSGRCLVATFNIGWIDPDDSLAVSLQRMRVIGEYGRLECDQTDRGITRMLPSGIDTPNPYFAEFLPHPERGEFFQGYGYRSVREFLMDVRDIEQNGRDPQTLHATRPTFARALQTTAVLEAVRESLQQNGAWQNVSDLLAT